MICTFCGAENPEENRFCGMCGVRLERRQADRRTRERRSSAEAARATAGANVRLPAPEARAVALQQQPEPVRAARPTFEPERSQADRASPVSGPSFLGLNEPGREGEYLLEEDRPSRRGLRLLLLLVVLAAIVGLIFVQYRSNLKANPKSPDAPNPSPANIPRPDAKNHPPAQYNQDQSLRTAAAVRNLQSAAVNVANVENLSMNAGARPLAAKTEGEENDPPVAGDDPPSDKAPKPSLALVKAQQYLHGQGVRQNCEQGLIYLRAAARENDPQAAVQMGALYSSGLCVNRDRVKAYEWFNSAREVEPQNHWIEKNLNELWAQMTPQERRQIHQ